MNQLSVVIPTRNRSDLLAGLLRSLQRQSLPDSEFEVLVIDNGSTDSTRQVVDEFRLHLANLRYFFEPRPGLHVGRHRGLKEARSDILVYADDDIEATDGWLSAICEAFADPGVSLLGGNCLPKFAETPPSWLLKLWQRPYLMGNAIPDLSIFELPGEMREHDPFHVWGCNFSIRKKVLMDAGGFHPDGMPEDLIRFRGDGETHVSKYIVESGLKCIFHPKATVYHVITKERMTMEYFRKRAFNQGVSDSFTNLRSHSNTLINDKNISLVSFIKNGVNRIRKKIHDFRRYDAEMQELEKIVAQGYNEGCNYHKRSYLKDLEVREWVHKANYME